MKRIEYFELLINLFKFRTIFDEANNEFVVFEKSHYKNVSNITDKTEFEAFENHIHLLDNVKKNEFEKLTTLAKVLGESLLCNLKFQYPQKKFIVYVSIRMYDSMIIRFHQKWKNEQPYCNPSEFTCPNEKIFFFES